MTCPATDNCGALGIRVTDGAQLDDALLRAIDHAGPSLVEILSDPMLV
jgi:thiamine pyrophosphate-dependent acetolactate synthase large subunit-like protein